MMMITMISMIVQVSTTQNDQEEEMGDGTATTSMRTKMQEMERVRRWWVVVHER